MLPACLWVSSSWSSFLWPPKPPSDEGRLFIISARLSIRITHANAIRAKRTTRISRLFVSTGMCGLLFLVPLRHFKQVFSLFIIKLTSRAFRFHAKIKQQLPANGVLVHSARQAGLSQPLDLIYVSVLVVVVLLLIVGDTDHHDGRHSIEAKERKYPR